MKRRALVGFMLLVVAIVIGLAAPAGADTNYPPATKSVVTVGASAVSRDPSAAPVQGAGLPRTGSNSVQLVWAGGFLLVAGLGLVVARGRRRAVRP